MKTNYELDTGSLVVDFDMQDDVVEINSVCAGTINIVEILSDEVCALIEEKCQIDGHQDLIERACEAADHRRDWLRDEGML